VETENHEISLQAGDQDTETGDLSSAPGPADDILPRVRNAAGRFLPIEASDPPELKRAKLRERAFKKQHQLTERDYLKAVTRQLSTAAVSRVVRALLQDAEGQEGADPKNVNAAREWIGKYALGGGKQSLDLILHPEVIQGKR
jgi:hypothetical protein